MAIDAHSIRIWEGDGTRLGATWDGLGVNFSLFSASANKVELCLFDSTGTKEVQRVALPGYNCIYDRQEGHTRDVVDHVMDLHLHMHQTFMNLLEVLVSHLNQWCP